MSNSSNSSRGSRIGYRFHPTDEEVINFLTDKVFGSDYFVQDQIAVLGDICNYEPWKLPGLSSMENSGDRVWYFFCTPNYKYKNSKRVNRTTRAGYWKVTGNHRKIKSRNGTTIGEKKTLVFYEGSIRKRNGKRTGWVIHEYQLPSNQKEWVVLCKLKKKGAEAADVSSDGSQPSEESPNNAVVEGINIADAICEDDLGDIDELYELCFNWLPEPEMQLQMQEEQQQPAPSSRISPSFYGSISDSTQNHYYSSGVNNEEEDESWLSYLVSVLPYEASPELKEPIIDN